MQILGTDFYFILQFYFWGNKTIEYEKNLSGHETAKQKVLNLVNREHETEEKRGLGLLSETAITIVFTATLFGIQWVSAALTVCTHNNLPHQQWC